MKIQAMFSLAAVGLAFATPIHNLEKRGEIEQCVKEAVFKALTQVFDDVSSYQKADRELLNSFIPCITNTATQLPDTTDLTQNPSEWLESVNTCAEGIGKDFIDRWTGRGVQFKEIVSVTFSESVSCFASRED
ncbi:hypothetical protein BDV39DRAFT_170597 [Aspergillus sergii]|uniref:Uncharacterized protein n=1 Tax=Aspergillus sergii TaxID=1034303 RepID=A0A5N6XAZ3_9EURO|nr:hypothetical protein BDV39DRAFT_170597 [Aspergillus sergii]